MTRHVLPDGVEVDTVLWLISASDQVYRRAEPPSVNGRTRGLTPFEQGALDKLLAYGLENQVTLFTREEGAALRRVQGKIAAARTQGRGEIE